MPTYAAIRVNQDTVIEMFENVVGIPDGRSRLAWALFNFPYEPEKEYFFIGGNYLGLNQPDFAKQIVDRSQLTAWFEYNPKSLDPRRNGPRKNGSWFPIKTRDGIIFRGPKRTIQHEIAGSGPILGRIVGYSYEYKQGNPIILDPQYVTIIRETPIEESATALGETHAGAVRNRRRQEQQTSP